MPNLNLLFFLNAYSDRHASNAPSRQNFKWSRDVNGLSVENPYSLEFTLAPGETRSLFSGVRTLSQDNTTQYSIALKPLTTNTYVLSWVGGTSPAFRTSRSSGADATTQVTVTLNGTLATFTSTAGTPFDLITNGVVPGDYVRIGNLFNILNQGPWQIISLTPTSFTVINPSAAAEGPITLGAGFASQIDMYSAAGVQVGDILDITGGFSPVSQGTYEITGVSDTFVEFSSLSQLPAEGPVTTQAIAIYSSAKRLVYIEADQKCALTINGVANSANITPMVNTTCGCTTQHGFFLLTSTVYSLSVTNNSINQATLYLASVE